MGSGPEVAVSSEEGIEASDGAGERSSEDVCSEAVGGEGTAKGLEDSSSGGLILSGRTVGEEGGGSSDGAEDVCESPPSEEVSVSLSSGCDTAEEEPSDAASEDVESVSNWSSGVAAEGRGANAAAESSKSENLVVLLVIVSVLSLKKRFSSKQHVRAFTDAAFFCS